MKVKDVMRVPTFFVEETIPLKKLIHIALSSGAFGFPVVNSKKQVVGVITQEDIFQGIYDSSGKKINDKELCKFLKVPVKNVMIKDVLTISPDMDFVEAQVLMYSHLFAQLPVVNEKKELIGIVTHGNMFKEVIENEIPDLETDQYASFMVDNYDIMTDWDKREELEFPTLFRVFKGANVKKIIDLGSWTGEYAIRLAREGIEVVGLDQNPIMIKYAESKRVKLPDNIKNKVSFHLTDFTDLHKLFKKGSVDGVIGVGTSLSYLPQKPQTILKNIHPLIKKDGVIVLQLLNLKRIVEDKGRFFNFRIKKVGPGQEKEELFIEFFDKKDEETLMHNVINFVRDGSSWVYSGINSIEIAYIKHDQIISLLREAGFHDITMSGNKGEYRGQYGQMSLIKPFDPKTSEWMTVFAKA